ncbi:MAG TPA: hypothetical protein VE288_14460 [Rubrobacteraceae bacterium]|nr:hypothetical protein [Rubrobacteraceae bacterium]
MSFEDTSYFPDPTRRCGRWPDVGVRPMQHYGHAREPTYQQEK